MASDAPSDDDNDAGNWEEWNDSEGSGDAEPARSLFCDLMLSSPEEAMQHDAQTYGFDIRQYAAQERLDEYDIFRCINFVRRSVRDGVDPLPGLKGPAGASASSAWRGNDDYLKPVMEDDALLFWDYEDVVNAWRAAAEQPGTSGSAPEAAVASGAAAAAKDEELQRLRDENEGLKEALAMLSASFMPEELKEEAARVRALEQQQAAAAQEQAGSSGTGSAAVEAAGPGPSSSAGPAPHSVAWLAQQARLASLSGRPPPLSSSAREVDVSYFDSYGGFGIHQDMLSDQPRTEAYRRALEGNPSLIKGKVVLDLGCGTGILSLFACRAGAAKVIAVEGNQRVASYARQICKANGYSWEDGGPMTVVLGKLEELDGLPVDKVDVLVSEWMGYALLFETMLDSVLYARDKFLKPGGAVLPDLATIYIAGASVGATGSHFWKDVYGFNMSPIGDEVRRSEMDVAHVHVVKEEDVVTEDFKLKELDLCTMSADDQDFTAAFTLVARPPPAAAAAAAAAAAGSDSAAGSSISGLSAALQPCHAIALWFDTEFSGRHCSEAPVRLSTSVHAQPTHWAQAVMVLREPVLLAVPGQALDASSPPSAPCLTGRISMARNKRKHRFLDISLEYTAQLSNGKTVSHTMLYSMSVQLGN